ncbi:MAG TPA: periplasmic heavy metal sensor [Chitinophagaceae bacterium]|nr:periplasmic heavy metal sensor [Chitinophagaceae bacterium]
MNNSSRNRNLLFIIAALVLTNVAVLVYFLWIKRPVETRRMDGKNGMTEMLKKEVGFNDEQVAQYKQLKDEQWASIKPMFDEMRKAKENLFRLLSDPNTSDSLVSKATNAIAEKQKTLDLQTFSHFKKVRAVCTPDQLPKYDSMIQRMFRKMGKMQRKNDQDKGEKK